MTNKSDSGDGDGVIRPQISKTLTNAAVEAYLGSAALLQEVSQVSKLLPPMSSAEYLEFATELGRVKNLNLQVLLSADKIITRADIDRRLQDFVKAAMEELRRVTEKEEK